MYFRLLTFWEPFKIYIVVFIRLLKNYFNSSKGDIAEVTFKLHYSLSLSQ